jgi:hypothetical protein
MSGHSVDVLKWAANRTPEQVNLYATIGASAHTAAGHSATHRLEFYTGLRPAQDQVARPLALLVGTWSFSLLPGAALGGD